MTDLSTSLVKDLTQKTLRFPRVLTATKGDQHGSATARQLDVALMEVGFKCSADLLGYLSACHPVIVTETAKDILDVVRNLVGDHVEHNVYFNKFPEGVPDTLEFWADCLADAMRDPIASQKVGAALSLGYINLLDLPKYGTYLHTYEQMLALHEPFEDQIGQKFTVLHLGKTLPEEANEVYKSLAESNVPLNEEDLSLLKTLAEVCLYDRQPETIPVRENRAVINAVRLNNGQDLLVDTVTDVLRLACALSGGDVTLQTKTKFKSFSKRDRRTLLAAIDTIPQKKLVDVKAHKEAWKRLGERLKPHNYPYRNAHMAFKIARGDKKVYSHASKVEQALAGGEIAKATDLLVQTPGVFVRRLDQLLRETPDSNYVAEQLSTVVDKVSTRVLLSVREHLQNRLFNGNLAELEADFEIIKKKHGVIEKANLKSVSLVTKKAPRVFANSKGTAYVIDDDRSALAKSSVNKTLKVIDKAIVSRLPETPVYYDKEILDVALPISNKNIAKGFNILPRGSESPISGDILRFFCYWKEKNNRTDFDLSAILLDENFQTVGQLSYTNLRLTGAVHSGDIVTAPKGASEFIDLDLNKVEAKYIVPQVNIFAGESFEEVEESFFGFMERTPAQKGKPFEAKTVKTKSDMRGKGKVALPLVFIKGEKGWTVKWMNLFLNGHPQFNATENNRLSTALIVRGIVERDYLKISYLTDLMLNVTKYDKRKTLDKNDTYLGLERPEKPTDSKVITVSNLHELIT